MQFIINNAALYTDKRQKGINNSLARSHAARAVHSARRRSLSQETDPLVNGDEKVLHKVSVPKPFKGNSDPFATYLPASKPEYIYILAFAKDVALPSTYKNTFARHLSGIRDTPKSSTIVKQQSLISDIANDGYWNRVIKGFDDAGVFYAFLNTYASAMGTVSSCQVVQTTAIEARLRALQYLRKKIQTPIDLRRYGPSLMMTIALLYEAECTEGNVTAAMSHVTMLQHFYQADYVENTFIARILANDVDMAVKNNMRNFSDLDWCGEQLKDFFDISRVLIPMPHVGQVALHPSISYTRLRKAWLWSRMTLQTMEESTYWNALWKTPDLRSMAFKYFISHGHLNQSILNNMYYDLVEAKVMQETTVIKRLTHAGLATAMLYLWHFTLGEWVVHGVDRRPWSAPLMIRLRSCLEMIIASSTDDERKEYAEPHLWLVYVGAMNEAIQKRKGNAPLGEENNWFGKRLWPYASKVGVLTWTAMQNLAESFFYAPFLGLDGSTWFEGVIMEGLVDDHSIRIGNTSMTEAVPVLNPDHEI